jgi:hypothetical protein
VRDMLRRRHTTCGRCGDCRHWHSAPLSGLPVVSASTGIGGAGEGGRGSGGRIVAQAVSLAYAVAGVVRADAAL